MSPGVAMSMPVVRAGAKSITAPALVPVLVALHMSGTDALADAVLLELRCRNPPRRPQSAPRPARSPWASTSSSPTPRLVSVAVRSTCARRHHATGNDAPPAGVAQQAFARHRRTRRTASPSPPRDPARPPLPGPRSVFPPPSFSVTTTSSSANRAGSGCTSSPRPMLGDQGQYGVPEYLTSNAGSEPLSDLMSVRSISMPPEAVAGSRRHSTPMNR